MSAPLFSQVYVIMARKHEGVLPILYVLLPNKRRATYVKMFQMITDLSADLQPKGMYCGYEQAAFFCNERMFSEGGVQRRFLSFCT